MTELLHHLRDPTHGLAGTVNNIPASFIETASSASSSSAGNNGNDANSMQATLRSNGPHSTPASNLKISENIRTADHDGSPSVVSSKVSSSKSFTSGFTTASTTVGNVVGGGGTPSSSAAVAAAAAIGLGSAGTVGGRSPVAAAATNFDISPNNTQFFEVMYVGKIKVSHKRVPLTFIDDALPKFKAYDSQRIKMQADAIARQVCFYFMFICKLTYYTMTYFYKLHILYFNGRRDVGLFAYVFVYVSYIHCGTI